MIYLDHHATTPVDPRALASMLPFFRDCPGNAASQHSLGRTAREAVEKARQQVGALIGAAAREIAFTSGATESNNLAIKGVCEALCDEGDHIVTQRTEHKAVLDSVKRMQRRGHRVTFLEVDGSGRVDPEDVRRALTDKTVLVSIMLSNNETGAVQDVAAIGAITRERGVYLHCDASQGLGYLPLDVRVAPVDLVSFTAHKIYGPKGVGALYARRRHPRVRVIAEMDGGGHEHGMRSGTLNVPGIVGFGAAAELQLAEGPAEALQLAELRERLYARLVALGEVKLNGPGLAWSARSRHPANLNVSFAGLDGAGLMLALSANLAVSSGSACSSASTTPSYVLQALGLSRLAASRSIRFGLGRDTTIADIDNAATHVENAVQRLREELTTATTDW